MKNRVVINAGDTDIRVAFLEDGRLVEYHREHLDNKSLVGNIYRGVVKDVVPGLQAAFIDVGLPRNVFLHFMDIRSESTVMLEENLEDALMEASKKVIPGRIIKRGRRDRPDPRAGNVESPVKQGDTIIVQVIKDGIGDKAPRVSSNLAIPGRYIVLLPFPSQDGGISRRVQFGDERSKLREIIRKIRTEQYSWIVRTAGLEAEEKQIVSDSERLVAHWNELVERFRALPGPGLVHTDHDIIDRLVRDAFSNRIEEIVADDHDIAEELRSALQTHLPELEESVTEHDDREPVFQRHNVEEQLQRALERKIWLKSGGYIYIEETEALVAIDVNTGRFTGSRDQEKTSLKINVEACAIIAEQIRVRDLGGILVVDFIDMLSQENRNRVSDEFKHAMRHDRAKSTIGHIGDGGLLTMTRKRKYQSLKNQLFDDCPYCSGEGYVLKTEEVWRRLKNDLLTLLDSPKRYSGALVVCQPQVAEFLESDFAKYLDAFEAETDLQIIVRAKGEFHREDYSIAGVEGPSKAAPRLHVKRMTQDDVFAESVRYEDIPDEQPAEKPAAKARAATKSAAKPAAKKPAAPVKESRRPAAAKAVKAQPAAAPAEEGQSPEQEAEKKPRRRGRRGGRGRGRGEKDAAADSAEQPLSSTEAAPPAPEPVAQPPQPAAKTRKPTARAAKPQAGKSSPPPARPRAEEGRGDVKIVSRYGKLREPARAAEPSATAMNRPLSGKVRVLTGWGDKPKAKPVAPVEKAAPAKAPEPAEKQILVRPPAVKVVASWGGGVEKKPAKSQAAPPVAEKKPAAKKTAAKKTAAKKSATGKSPAKKSAGKTTAAKKSSPARKSAAKKTAAKAPAARPAKAKAATARKTSGRKAASGSAKKAAKKSTARKATRRQTS